MKLGTYVEILHYVSDTAAAGANPSLRYYGSDVAALKARGLAIVDGRLSSPAGISIQLESAAPPRALPHSNVARAADQTRLGKFGELSAFIADIEVECAFWEAAGYQTLGKYSAPSPWGIWCDDMFLIGLHQDAAIAGQEPFAICHFSPEMKSVNAQLLDEGFALQPFDNSADPSDLTYQKLLTPFGLLFYLFTGDISEAQP